MKGKRNPVARSPLLKKGGAHDDSRGARRQKNRAELRRQTDEAWRYRHANKKGADWPPSHLQRRPQPYTTFGSQVASPGIRASNPSMMS